MKNPVYLENRIKVKDFRVKKDERDDTDFWQLWLQHQDYLYKRCLSWMKGNHEQAEEALSRARIKAWEKWLEVASKVTNPKAWLTKLTHNLCMDMHRERVKAAIRIDRFEKIAATEDSSVFASMTSPEAIIINRELDACIRNAVDALPTKLRTAFLLRCYQEMPYQEIAKQLAISNDSARKRVQQARIILQKKLHSYVLGLDNSQLQEPTCSSETEVRKIDTKPGFSIVKNNKKQVSCDKLPTTKILINTRCTSGLINYKITAICLEKLPHIWYSSSSFLD